jgi:membrane protein
VVASTLVSRRAEHRRDEATTPPPDATSKPDSPGDLHKHSWTYVARKTLREFSDDECLDLAAALTYYSVLALFPAMLALLSLLGLVVDPQQAVDTALEVLRPLVSPELISTLEQPLHDLATSNAAGAALVIGVAGALWSASGYVGAFGRAMNRIYEIGEGRPFWKLRPVMLVITLAAVVLIAVVLVLLVVSGPVAQSIGDVIGLGGRPCSSGRSSSGR